MEKIWAPWRMKYIELGIPGKCFFCANLEADNDRESLILHRASESFILMNKFPYSNGHLMIAPYRHTGEISELTTDEMSEMMELSQLSIKVLRDVMSPHGFNIGYNLGRVAGAGIVDHIHLHIVPRWNGDTNFMPIIADTKVINEKLEATYDKLIKSFHKLL